MVCCMCLPRFSIKAGIIAMIALPQTAIFYILFICTANSYCTPDVPHKPFVRRSFYLDLFAQIEVEFAEALNESKILRWEISSRNLASEYLKTYHENTNTLRGYASALTSARKSALITSSSFSVYQLVHRWIYQLRPLREHLQSKPDILGLLSQYQGFTKEDLNESMNDILRILHVYVFDVSMAVDGVLGDLNVGTRLSSAQCFQIAEFARERSYLALSIQLHEEALKKSKSMTKREAIERSFNQTVKEHDSFVRNKSLHLLSKQYLFDRRIAPLIKRYGREEQKYFRIYQRVQIPQTPLEDMPKFPVDRKTEISPHASDICRFSNLQTDEEKSLLFCWYESSIDPYFRINPLKMELHSAKPELIQIYGVIPKRMVQLTKETIVETSRRNRTYPVGLGPSVETVAEYKPVSFSSIEPKILSAFKAWGPKRLTRSNVHLSTPGSMLYLHTDVGYGFAYEGSVDITILYYVEEPELGGETYFLFPRISVKPVTGSALVYINTLQEGARDFEMYHGACPVLLGRKIGKNLQLLPKDPRKSPHIFEKSKQFPKSKVLNQKLYPKLKGEYLENKHYAGSEALKSIQ